MLIYGKPDFTDFVTQRRVYNFTRITFDEEEDPTFKANADWSVAILGRIKYSELCDSLIANRATEPRRYPEGIQEFTVIVNTNVEMKAFIDGALVAW